MSTPTGSAASASTACISAIRTTGSTDRSCHRWRALRVPGPAPLPSSDHRRGTTAMTELQTTHRTTVTEDMIAHPGHMTVRYYGAAARAASDELVRRFGGAGALPVDAGDLCTPPPRDQPLNSGPAT